MPCSEFDCYSDVRKASQGECLAQLFSLVALPHDRSIIGLLPR